MKLSKIICLSKLFLKIKSYFPVNISAPNMTAHPTTILSIAYKNATPVCPPFFRSVVSSANVEKVVKPPHNPTFKNKIHL